MSHPQFRLFRRRSDHQYCFNLTAKNGQVILQSEAYRSKPAARNGIKSVKANARKASRVERRTARNGKYYFVITAPNGQVVGRSQMYASASGRANGIRSVATNAGRARVADET